MQRELEREGSYDDTKFQRMVASRVTKAEKALSDDAKSIADKATRAHYNRDLQI